MMAIVRATWQSSNFWIVDPELLCTQITEDGCSEQYLRWQLLIPWILPLHRLEWCHHYLEWCHHHQKVEQYGDMAACHSIPDSIIQSFDDSFRHSNYCIIRSFDHAIIRLFDFDHSIFNHTFILLFKHSILKSFDHSIARLLDPLIIQSLIYYSFDFWIFQSWRHEYQLSFIMW